jgi:Sulfotransferase family
MLVSHRKNFIYTKTVKTAGTSVESYFERYCMPESEWEFTHHRKEYVGEDGVIGFRGEPPKGTIWRNHMPADEIRRLVGDDIWDRYFKFCVVRNPYDKLISGYYFFMYRENLKMKDAPRKLKDRFKGFIDRFKHNGNRTCGNDVDGFRRWLKKRGGIMDRDKYMIDDRVCVDFFILYEELLSGIKHVCERLEIPYEPERIPKLKSGIRNNDLPVSEYYDTESIKIVKELYSFELEKFGYEMP